MLSGDSILLGHLTGFGTVRRRLHAWLTTLPTP